MARISTFDDWRDLFTQWQRDIDLDTSQLNGFEFDVKFGEAEREIEFGHFAGQPKWERVTQIPDQRIRDALLNYIVVQGDTEFASVEQQRYLFATAPSEYDRQSLGRIMAEETRHGWQMSYLLVTYFGSSGKLEAEKLLQRRAFDRSRLLGSFNEDINNWLDMFVFTQFIDRDGKYQLKMLKHSGFAPLARSMGPMLREESFHLGTGQTGLKRVLRAEKIPVWLLQKYFNKWISTAYDLFGTDHSSSAQWAYEWGLKGRFNEEESPGQADRSRLNEDAREQYIAEISKLTVDLNRLIPEDQPKLVVPDVRFNRKIGDFARQPYDIHGNLLSAEAFAEYRRQNLPSDEDRQLLAELLKNNDWVAPRGTVAAA